MPSAKTARASERKRVQNRTLITSARTHLRKAEKLIQEKNQEVAQEAVGLTTKAFDKAAQKGAIHKNNASRHISRLAKKLNTLKS